MASGCAGEIEKRKQSIAAAKTAAAEAILWRQPRHRAHPKIKEDWNTIFSDKLYISTTETTFLLCNVRLGACSNGRNMPRIRHDQSQVLVFYFERGQGTVSIKRNNAWGKQATLKQDPRLFLWRKLLYMLGSHRWYVSFLKCIQSSLGVFIAIKTAFPDTFFPQQLSCNLPKRGHNALQHFATFRQQGNGNRRRLIHLSKRGEFVVTSSQLPSPCCHCWPTPFHSQPFGLWWKVAFYFFAFSFFHSSGVGVGGVTALWAHVPYRMRLK